MIRLVYFCITFLLVYLIYYFMVISKSKYDIKKIPSEVKYVIYKYNLDVNKLDYKAFLNNVAMVGSLDIALLFLIVDLINVIWLKILVGFISVVPIVLISFKLLGRHYKDYKKEEGEDKDDSTRDRK